MIGWVNRKKTPAIIPFLDRLEASPRSGLWILFGAPPSLGFIAGLLCQLDGSLSCFGGAYTP